ncbi:hypothetical protein TWF225_000604 [Orbilia oligospora]|uniref:F-box domain-containing protein n=1 Tax=Orbilia oligospora TaxID=2813651 RepID=A0A8H2DM29_ORBOL|nr:hypothetical protein TWF225_000604 [Orbilia oligospora]KAF3264680.1 hypothetical protein TWF128_001134 [Orbilia oligospora]KAF3268464.1 hypothetical protein TWF217_011050 [Orbilia oligospora]KAF3280339.1 hypothetical protein TWF132_011800 [Orbilia oligospora]TGJ62576.1 hypothetical protein EYR41_011766 [Orbilia oligospora]
MNRAGYSILALPLDIKLYLLFSVPDSQTLFSLAKTCKTFYAAFVAHKASLLRFARLKELHVNRLFLSGYAINCLWRDSTQTKSGVLELCAYMRRTYFYTHEFGPSGERGSLVGLMEQLGDRCSPLRGLMRSHDPAIDVAINGIGTSPQFYDEASQAVDVLHELVDRFWIFWNRLPTEDREEYYDSYLVTRKIVMRSILGIWILRLLQAKNGPYPPLHFYQENGIEKLSKAATDDSDTCMMGFFEEVTGGEWKGGMNQKYGFSCWCCFSKEVSIW